MRKRPTSFLRQSSADDAPQECRLITALQRRGLQSEMGGDWSPPTRQLRHGGGSDLYEVTYTTSNNEVVERGAVAAHDATHPSFPLARGVSPAMKWLVSDRVLFRKGKGRIQLPQAKCLGSGASCSPAQDHEV